MTTSFALEQSHQNNEAHQKAMQMRDYLEHSAHEELALMAQALGIASLGLDAAALRARLISPLVSPTGRTRPEH